MTAVKICGICRPEDAAQATQAGATYLGVILSAGHARSRAIEQAAQIWAACTARRVGVFVNEAVAVVLDAARRLRLDVVQLHGSESSETVQRIIEGTDAEVWKAARIRTAADLEQVVGMHPHVHGVLLDGWSTRAHGGTGTSFDWHALVQARDALPAARRVIVAGGLSPQNVAEVIRLLRPDVVDVSSGVEQSVGVKSAAAVEAFIVAAHGAQTSHD